MTDRTLILSCQFTATSDGCHLLVQQLNFTPFIQIWIFCLQHLITLHQKTSHFKMSLHKPVRDPTSMMKPDQSEIQYVYLAFLSLMHAYLEYQLAYSTLHNNSPPWHKNNPSCVLPPVELRAIPAQT